MLEENIAINEINISMVQLMKQVRCFEFRNKYIEWSLKSWSRSLGWVRTISLIAILGHCKGLLLAIEKTISWKYSTCLVEWQFAKPENAKRERERKKRSGPERDTDAKWKNVSTDFSFLVCRHYKHCLKSLEEEQVWFERMWNLRRGKSGRCDISPKGFS